MKYSKGKKFGGKTAFTVVEEVECNVVEKSVEPYLESVVSDELNEKPSSLLEKVKKVLFTKIF